MPGKNNRAKGLYEKPYSPVLVKMAKGVTAFHANNFDSVSLFLLPLEADQEQFKICF